MVMLTPGRFCNCGPVPGRRQYGKALDAVQALRDGAADTFDKAPGFNAALRNLAAAFEAHPQHRAWWCALAVQPPCHPHQVAVMPVMPLMPDSLPKAC